MSKIFQVKNLFHQRDADNTEDKAVAVAAAALVIPVTHGYVAKTTGGAEALTLANGYNGQILVVNLVATGGAGTITPATSTGLATVVLAAAGDQAILLYVDDTIGWLLLSVTGTAVALTPLYTV